MGYNYISRANYLYRLAAERERQFNAKTLPSIKQKIFKYLNRYNGSFTAWQIANGILENGGSVSSELTKMRRNGEVKITTDGSKKLPWKYSKI